MKEINMLKEIDHENVIRYLHWERFKSHISIYSVHYESDLFQYLRYTMYPIDGVVIQKISFFILRGLWELERRGIVHGNLRPANILIESKFNLKLSDFR